MGRDRYTPQQQEFYKKYLASRAWKARKAARIARAGGVCEFVTTYHEAGGTREVRCTRRTSLCVHHNTYERLGVELDKDLDVYCFPPGVLVRMADGSHRAIEAVSPGDFVFSAEGNKCKVIELHDRKYAGPLVTVVAFGHRHLRLTPNHPVLTQRGYVPAGELRRGDYVAAPKHRNEPARTLATASHLLGVRRRVPGTAKKYDWSVKPVPPEDWQVKRTPANLSLTGGSGRIFGLWLAEGYHQGNSVFWAFNASERHTLVAELIRLVRTEWGLTAKYQPGPVPSVALVRLDGVLWRQLFLSLCGRGAASKKLHPDLLRGSNAFLRGLFYGWMDGDGCSRGKRRAYRCGTTVSHELAMGMYAVATTLGLAPAIWPEKPQNNKYARTRRPAWKVQVNTVAAAHYRFHQDDEFVWRRVHKLTRSAYSGRVYNLGVATDHSYVAEGLAVHNCWYHHILEHLLWKKCRLCGNPCLGYDSLAELWLTATLAQYGIDPDARKFDWKALPTKEELAEQINHTCHRCRGIRFEEEV